jgi:hypothetical protein
LRRPRPPSPPAKPSASSPWPGRAATADLRHSAAIAEEAIAPADDPAPPRPALRRSLGDRRSLLGADGREFDAAHSEPLPPAAEPAEKAPRETPARPPILELDRGQRAQDRARSYLPFDRSPSRIPEQEAPREPSFAPAHEGSAHGDFSEPMLESSFAIDDADPGARGRPVYPVAQDEEVEPVPGKISALLAWRPSRELIRGLAAATAAVALIGILAWQWPNMVAAYRAMRAPATDTARDTPPNSVRSKITDRIEPASQSSSAVAPATPTGASVAQKVVLYEEDPTDPNGRRFVGSAIWRTETVSPGPGQPPELAIRADVEVPERKLTMTWSLRRNTDKALPASHTVEIMFKLPTDFPAGGISNVPGILMKAAEQTRGVPLSGLAVKVTNGFFLIGLSSTETDKDRNLQLLKDRAWFDIPVVYNNNRRAILAMEKGTPGERAFAEAFRVWKQ